MDKTYGKTENNADTKGKATWKIDERQESNHVFKYNRSEHYIFFNIEQKI